MWSSDINININNISAGIYFLQLKTETRKCCEEVCEGIMQLRICLNLI